MAHIHSVYDTDLHFRIDPPTRTIVNMSGKVVIVQHDHNSERFTFEIPRYVDGHDMSLCNNVEIHYTNGDIDRKSRGFYPVDDLQVDPEDDKYVIFSWLISHEATRYVGPLNFLIRFECLTEENIDYAWSTSVHSGVTISQGIYNTDSFVDYYIDTLELWKNDLKASAIEGPYIILQSSTEGSSKRFKITVDDSGVLAATELT